MTRVFFPPISRRKEYKQRRHNQTVGFYVYTRYRKETREDCVGACYYCDRHEDEIGGEEEIELDHFRPYSYTEFAHLENDPRNLVWSCHKCNNLKLEKWPARGTSSSHAGGKGFIDRFGDDDAADYFSVQHDGKIVPLKDPAQWIITELKLNRDGLVIQRRDRLQTIERICNAIELLDRTRKILLDTSLPPSIVTLLNDHCSELIRYLENSWQSHAYLFQRIRAYLLQRSLFS